MQSNLIDVPQVTQLPELSGFGESPIGFADMVLTSLLTHDEALLHAEHRPTCPQDDSVSWFVRPKEGDLEDLEMAVSPTLGSFNAVLTRFSEHYMDGVKTHGYSQKILRQDTRIHRCHFYLSNSPESGIWLRVFATRVTVR